MYVFYKDDEKLGSVTVNNLEPIVRLKTGHYYIGGPIKTTLFEKTEHYKYISKYTADYILLFKECLWYHVNRVKVGDKMYRVLDGEYDSLGDAFYMVLDNDLG